jgi:hypothetical protein
MIPKNVLENGLVEPTLLSYHIEYCQHCNTKLNETNTNIINSLLSKYSAPKGFISCNNEKCILANEWSQIYELIDRWALPISSCNLLSDDKQVLAYSGYHEKDINWNIDGIRISRNKKVGNIIFSLYHKLPNNDKYQYLTRQVSIDEILVKNTKLLTNSNIKFFDFPKNYPDLLKNIFINVLH